MAVLLTAAGPTAAAIRMIRHILPERTFCQTGDISDPLIHYIPHAKGQMTTVSAMDLHAGEAVPVKLAAGDLTGAEIPAFPDHLEKPLLDLHGLFLFSLPLQAVLQQS